MFRRETIKLNWTKILIVTILFVVNYNGDLYAGNLQEIDIVVYEDSLNYNFLLLSSEVDDNKKEILNKKIINLFRNIFENKNSFNYTFDSLKNKIGMVTSSDSKLRIICWNIPYVDGTHRYYGFIQYQKSKKNYFVYELDDKSEFIKKPEIAILSHNSWYGALYYKIITNKYKGNVYYTLLGADLNNLYTKKKIVEILYFNDKDIPVFGAQVFKNKRSSVSRVIIEFSAQTNMILTFDEEKEMIIYDHLSPSRPSLEGRYEFYGPDFTYNGLKFERGIWNAYSDVDVRNNNIE